jgi:hypothetical protein
MITVRCPLSAALIPVAAATEVFPTPPFPAKNMILIVFSTQNQSPDTEGLFCIIEQISFYGKKFLFQKCL